VSRRRTAIVATATSALFAIGIPAAAMIPASSPDDICAPTDDPCIIDDHYVITGPGPFDFGLRTVSIVSGGLLEGTIDIICGELNVTAGGNNTVVDIQNVGSPGGTFTVTTRRACSGDGTTPCLGDNTCALAALGTCSVGSGAILFDGEIAGNGDPGGSVIMQAAGDITLANTIRLNGSDFETNGGFMEVESTMGSVTITGSIKARAGATTYYGGSYGGEIALTAAEDLSLAKVVELQGGAAAGLIGLYAGNDLSVTDDILAHAGQALYAYGGFVNMGSASGDITVSSPNPGPTRLVIDGGTGLAYGGHLGPGSAGCFSFYAGGNLTFAEGTVVSGLGGFGGFYGESLGANVYAYAEGGMLTIDGEIHTHGQGAGGQLGRLFGYGSTGIRMGSKSKVNVKAKYAGYVELKAASGTIEMKGEINATGKRKGSGYYSYPGYGGSIYVKGDVDVVLDNATLLNGSDGSSEGIEFKVCRLRMINNAKIDGSIGSNPDASNTGNYFTIGESMYVQAGSKIIADEVSGAYNYIDYRDPNKPPVLNGTIDPPPELDVNPSIGGCPVCGNSEIDQGESCDDGNLTSGDGCRDDCQDEGCIAETPGYPGTALCDDGDGCTIDSCDPVGHTCNNVLNCEEGVACTVDSCVSMSCVHTPEDGLCDDLNDCTDDVCNSSTGCVYANLTGPACEDGDLCTVTGTCDAGTCIATDERHTSRNKILAKFKPDVADDQLRVKFEMPLAFFSSDPTVTGAAVELRDALHQTVFSADLGAADWEDKGGSGTSFSFRDTLGLGGPANGVEKARVKVIASNGIAKASVKMRGTELPGAAGQLTMSFSMLFGTDPATDDCLTARSIPCKAKTKRTICKD